MSGCLKGCLNFSGHQPHRATSLAGELSGSCLDTIFILGQSIRLLPVETKRRLLKLPGVFYTVHSLRADVMSQNDMDNPSQLCASCSSIDFRKAFALSSNEIGSRGVAITATRNEIQADCNLCSCVVSIFSDVNTNDGLSALTEFEYHFRALHSLWVFERPIKFRSEGGSDVVIATVRGKSDQELEPKQLLEAISLGLILPLAQRSALHQLEIPRYQYRGRIVNSLLPDFTRIRSWIDECHSLQPNCHFKCKSSRGNMSFQSRVIDCWTRQVVPLTRDLEYLALSYVWGSVIDDKNSQAAQTSGFVPYPAPQTIEDAMSVVRSMKKSYLWVDRYCIWQSENRHLQIQNMHEIYRNALSTIVPVEADSADFGFSGVSIPRCNQFRFWTNAGLLVFTFAHISYHLSSSIWLTRGWTYQEAFLSRSCIFFTRDQVYFACRSNHQSEAVEQVQEPPHDIPREILEPKLLSYADYLDAYRRSASERLFFYEHIYAYTRRSLTLDSDGLNAFEGIIKSGDTKSFWGIVSYRSNHSEFGFAVGLAWSGLRQPPGGGPIRRREGFPTWSWVSLVDRIENAVRATGSCDTLDGCSTFYVEDENEQRIRIADIYKRTAGSGALVFSNFKNALFIEANITQVHLLWSEKAGICSVHASKSPFHSETTPSSSPLKVIDVMAWIDDEDDGLLSNIESRPWHAVQLFWKQRKVGADVVQFGYWMLVDEREPVAHRVGIIAPVSHDAFWLEKGTRAERALILMQDLETARRLIKIE